MRRLLPFLFVVVDGPAFSQAAAPPPIVVTRTQVDPVRLELGRSVAAKMLAPGASRKAASAAAQPVVLAVGEQIINQPLVELLRGAGVPAGEVAGHIGANSRAALRIVDPALFGRITVFGPVVEAAVAEAMSRHEGEVREALAISYADHLTASQLQGLDAFLKTPSGTAYADARQAIEADLRVQAAQGAYARDVVANLPATLAEARAAAAELPKPKTAADLTDAERQQLATLLSIDPARLKP